MAKISISLDDNLLTRVDDFAQFMYTSRSGLISSALIQYLNANQISQALTDLSVSMRKIADTGSVDDDTLRKLSDLETLVRVICTHS